MTIDMTSVRRRSRSPTKIGPNLQPLALSNAGRLARQERHSYVARSGHFNLAAGVSGVTILWNLTKPLK